VGALVETIRDGGWCAEQASLMRGYAYGILDPQGDRHRMARMHRDECPACRAYVTSLRGLAAALPPVFPPWPLAAAVLAGAGSQAGTGVGGALSASGAASAGGTAGAGGAAGGSWLLAGGPLGAKLAAGCLLAIGVGVGCVALGAGPDRGREGVRRRGSVGAARLLSPTPAGRPAAPALGAGRSSLGGARARARPLPVGSTAPRDTIVREFGPEQGGEVGASLPVASAGRRAAGPTATAAQREFGPG
jgi:hypothetical protein